MKFFISFKLTLVTDGWVMSCEIPLSRMSLNHTDDKPTLVQVMAWCRQATSQYLNQCWPRSMSPYGVTRPQWVKVMKYWEQAVTCAMIYLCYNISGNGVTSIIYPDTSLSYSLNQTFDESNLAHFSNISVHICTFKHICNYLGDKNMFRDVKVVKKCCPKGVWKGDHLTHVFTV